MNWPESIFSIFAVGAFVTFMIFLLRTKTKLDVGQDELDLKLMNILHKKHEPSPTPLWKVEYYPPTEKK